jgi:hypothetical protein
MWWNIAAAIYLIIECVFFKNNINNSMETFDEFIEIVIGRVLPLTIGIIILSNQF